MARPSRAGDRGAPAGGHLRRREVGRPARQALDLAALLIDGDQQRRVAARARRALQRAGQRQQLAARGRCSARTGSPSRPAPADAVEQRERRRWCRATPTMIRWPSSLLGRDARRPRCGCARGEAGAERRDGRSSPRRAGWRREPAAERRARRASIGQAPDGLALTPWARQSSTFCSSLSERRRDRAARCRSPRRPERPAICASWAAPGVGWKSTWPGRRRADQQPGPTDARRPGAWCARRQVMCLVRGSSILACP